MTLRSVASVVAVATLSLGVLAGCGGDSDEPSGNGDISTTGAAGSEDDVPADGSEGEEPAASEASFADCSAITPDEMGVVLGEGVGSAEVPPASDYCAYALDDPTQPSVTIEQFTTDDFADGWDGAKANITSTAIGTVEGTPTSVEAGDDAEVVVGPSVGGSSLQSIGLVLVGDTIVRASVLQAIDLDEAAMTDLTTQILALVASKA